MRKKSKICKKKSELYIQLVKGGIKYNHSTIITSRIDNPDGSVQLECENGHITILPTRDSVVIRGLKIYNSSSSYVDDVIPLDQITVILPQEGGRKSKRRRPRRHTKRKRSRRYK